MRENKRIPRSTHKNVPRILAVVGNADYNISIKRLQETSRRKRKMTEVEIQSKEEYLGHPVVDDFLILGDGSGRTDLRATHRCGHILKARGVAMYSWGKYHASRYSEMVCYECYKSTVEAKEQAEKAGLPELTGSPKQTAWATTIRARVLAAVEAEAGAEAVAAISTHTDSSWWIDHRSTPAYRLAQENSASGKEHTD
jgi:hypothetical protein